MVIMVKKIYMVLGAAMTFASCRSKSLWYDMTPHVFSKLALNLLWLDEECWTIWSSNWLLNVLFIKITVYLTVKRISCKIFFPLFILWLWCWVRQMMYSLNYPSLWWIDYHMPFVILILIFDQFLISHGKIN